MSIERSSVGPDVDFEVERTYVTIPRRTVSCGELYGCAIDRVVAHGVVNKNWDNCQDYYQEDATEIGCRLTNDLSRSSSEGALGAGDGTTKQVSLLERYLQVLIDTFGRVRTVVN